MITCSSLEGLYASIFLCIFFLFTRVIFTTRTTHAASLFLGVAFSYYCGGFDKNPTLALEMRELRIFQYFDKSITDR